ncbi:MAG: PAS domain-containing protein, partial [Myxococcota bacterium]
MLGRSMAGDHYLKDELYELVRTDRTVFDFLQSGSLDGLWYWDLENLEVEWISPEFWRILGYDPAEKPHLASEWHKVLAPEGRESALERLRRYAEDPNHRYDEIVRYLHADGSAVWLRCRGLVIRDAEGTPTRMLGVHNDVTALQNARVDAERLRTEVEAHQVHESERRSALERLNRDLKRSNTELSTFAFTASHDLKEPLRSVTAYAEILQERIGAELDPTSQRQLARILEGGRRMERLIEDLLELAQAGAAEFLVSNVDLNTCVAA